MRRMLLPLALIAVALSVGCGSTKANTNSKTLSVRDVERTFFQAGVPFQQELLPQSNPYLRPQAGTTLADFAIPRGSTKHLQTLLVQLDAATFNTVMAYVFDSKKSADAALRAKSLSTWLESNHPVIRAQKLNVIIVAATNGRSRFAQRVRRPIAALG